MKTTLGKSRTDTLLSGVDKDDKMPLGKVVITTSEHMAIMPTERRTARMQGMVTPTEKKDFLANFGREKESEILREFVLMVTGKPTAKTELRRLIINLMNNK